MRPAIENLSHRQKHGGTGLVFRQVARFRSPLQLKGGFAKFAPIHQRATIQNDRPSVQFISRCTVNHHFQRLAGADQIPQTVIRQCSIERRADGQRRRRSTDQRRIELTGIAETSVGRRELSACELGGAGESVIRKEGHRSRQNSGTHVALMPVAVRIRRRLGDDDRFRQGLNCPIAANFTTRRRHHQAQRKVANGGIHHSPRRPLLQRF